MAKFKHEKKLNDYEFVLAVNEYLKNHYSIHYAKSKLNVTYYSYDIFYHKKTKKLISNLIQDYRNEKKTCPYGEKMPDQLVKRFNELQDVEAISTKV